MKNITSIFMLLISIPGHSQIQEFYDISWKINNNDSVNYDMILASVDPDSITISNDSLLRFMQSDKSIMTEAIYGHMKVEYDGYPISLTLKGIDNKIQAWAVSNNKFDFTQKPDLFSRAPIINQILSHKGNNHSFWMEPRRAAITELLLKLPDDSISVDNYWSINTTFTRMYYPEYFVRDSSYRKNQIRLVSVNKIESDLIATYDYNIEEYVKGSYLTDEYSRRLTGVGESVATFNYRAKCEFNITKGRIESLYGIQIQKYDTTEKSHLGIVKYELKYKNE